MVGTPSPSAFEQLDRDVDAPLSESLGWRAVEVAGRVRTLWLRLSATTVLLSDARRIDGYAMAGEAPECRERAAGEFRDTIFRGDLPVRLTARDRR